MSMIGRTARIIAASDQSRHRSAAGSTRPARHGGVAGRHRRVPEGRTSMSVDITEPTSLERAHAAAGPLGRAALAALRAPAVLDAQPWRWRLRGHVGELWADPT